MIRENLVIPYHVKRGIRPNEIGAIRKPAHCVGMDLETNEETGEPFLLVMCDESGSKAYPCCKINAFQTFSSLLQSILSRSRATVVGFHNLEFDLTAMLLPQKDCFRESYFEVKNESTNTRLKIYFGKVIWGYFEQLTDTSTRRIKFGPRRILIIDTARFFPYSLAKVAKDLQLNHQKMPYPGQHNTQEFIQYAINDGLVQRDLVEHIVSLHKKFDLKMTVSTPAFAQRFFATGLLHGP